MRHQLILSSLLAVIMMACDPGENSVPEPPVVYDITLDMGGDGRKNQIFFNLADTSATNTIDRTAWDLSFEASAEGWVIFLNTANCSKIYRTETSDFAGVSAIGQLPVHYDASSQSPDSTAVGDYRNQMEVYILDRGFDTLGNPLGKVKFMVLSHSASEYVCRFADLNGDNLRDITIPKDPLRNRVALSLTSNTVVACEPETDQWHLLFTRYCDVIYSPVWDLETHYGVSGVLINRNYVAVAVDTSHTFDEIDIALAAQQAYGDAADVIGYNWKFFDGQDYTIDFNRNFVLRDADQRYFKLRFLDFVNADRQSGYPRFEMVELY
ncbi:MAG: HmuY family protein [Bacteroidota bacterium]